MLFDLSYFLKGETLQLFELRKGTYMPRAERWLPEIGLGLTLWHGSYEKLAMEWLRWCYQDGTLVPTGAERAAAEAQRAAAEAQRAERLAAKLRELGIDPDEV